MSAIAGGAAIGAGVGISSVALMPFNAANTFLGSAFFGYGMILGERYMYQADWPKIQQRLENGEKIENIIQEYTGRFTAVVMAEAKIIFDSVTSEMLQIMKTALLGTTGTQNTPEGTTLTVTTEQTGETPSPSPTPSETTSIKQDVSGYVIYTNPAYDTEYRTRNGSGRVLKSATNTLNYLHTNTQIGTGKWLNLSSGATFEQLELTGNKVWPASGYFKVKPNTTQKQIYWFLNKCKL